MYEASVLRPDERASCLLRGLYRRHGYLPYHMSKFEEYDLYVRNKSFLVSDKVLTFTDTDGRLMALKPDVTLSIVKNAPDTGRTLHKVCYNEHVYRAGAAGYREIMQTGLECIGPLDLLAMAEVVALAAESLALLGEDYLLDLGHMGVVSDALTWAEEDLRRALLTEIGRKNSAGVAALCRRAGADEAAGRILQELAALYGAPSQVLPRLEALTGAGPAFRELESLCRLLEDMGCAGHLRLDFSIVNDMSYYNGVIFRGYLPGLASGVLAGGRYDRLLHKMGRQDSAIGFSVYLDRLERLSGQDEDFDADILLLYGPGDDPAAVAREASRLRHSGSSVRTEQTPPPEGRYRQILQAGGPT